ncbi:hypothetical protein [Kribbella sp. NPDC004536]|uniref:hypothetical protein n=1 Tax=Kribbella sp. NPDC004536 TaxID=3364106 RepID=UPI0036778DE4
MVDYQEYYEIGRPAFERYRRDPDSALEFANRCREHQVDEHLLMYPGGRQDTATGLVAAIDERLASEDLEEVYSALIDIGKREHHDLADRVVPYLISETDFLREAAVRTLVFYFQLPQYKADAIRLLHTDPDEGVRQVAAMGLRKFAANDPELLQQLLAVTVDVAEQDIVRDEAYISALAATGSVPRSEFPMTGWLPNFDARADWPLLEDALKKAGIPVPPAIAERATRTRDRAKGVSGRGS